MSSREDWLSKKRLKEKDKRRRRLNEMRKVVSHQKSSKKSRLHMKIERKESRMKMKIKQQLGKKKHLQTARGRKRVRKKRMLGSWMMHLNITNLVLFLKPL